MNAAPFSFFVAKGLSGHRVWRLLTLLWPSDSPFSSAREIAILAQQRAICLEFLQKGHGAVLDTLAFRSVNPFLSLLWKTLYEHTDTIDNMEKVASIEIIGKITIVLAMRRMRDILSLGNMSFVLWGTRKDDATVDGRWLNHAGPV